LTHGGVARGDRPVGVEHRDAGGCVVKGADQVLTGQAALMPHHATSGPIPRSSATCLLQDFSPRRGTHDRAAPRARRSAPYTRVRPHIGRRARPTEQGHRRSGRDVPRPRAWGTARGARDPVERQRSDDSGGDRPRRPGSGPFAAGRPAPSDSGRCAERRHSGHDARWT
jgi:hypothetical protein